jgi:hypothetical protein
MTWAIFILCLILAYREFMFTHERKQWHIERKDLYSRIQAGSLQEYERIHREPSQPVQKDREQRVSESAEDKGLMRQDLQYPSQWKG